MAYCVNRRMCYAIQMVAESPSLLSHDMSEFVMSTIIHSKLDIIVDAADIHQGEVNIVHSSNEINPGYNSTGIRLIMLILPLVMSLCLHKLFYIEVMSLI